MDNTQLINSSVGCLIGMAVGDALGFIVEGYDGNVCKQYVDIIVKKIDCPIMLRRPKYIFGQYSDDTQLAREYLISHCQTNGEYQPAVYANRIAMMFMPKGRRIVSVGRQIAAAAEKIRKGEHHSKSGCKLGHGNGSAMRTPPLGIIFSKLSEKEMDARVSELSAITHASQCCIDACIAIARATKYGMIYSGKIFNVADFISYISQGTSESYAKCLDNVFKMIKNNSISSYASDSIIEMGKSFGEKDWGKSISSGVVQSSLWALWSVCKYPDSYVDCIAESILPGGDIDTTAAMAGGIIGARVGLKGIPAIWAEKLHDIDEWNYNDLVELAKIVVA